MLIDGTKIRYPSRMGADLNPRKWKGALSISFCTDIVRRGGKPVAMCLVAVVHQHQHQDNSSNSNSPSSLSSNTHRHHPNSSLQWEAFRPLGHPTSPHSNAGAGPQPQTQQALRCLVSTDETKVREIILAGLVVCLRRSSRGRYYPLWNVSSSFLIGDSDTLY